MIAVETAAGEAPISAWEEGRLLPSLSTRSQLNEIERLSITAARAWAMRDAVLRRPGLLSEAFSRDLHRRMFSGIWRDAGRYRTHERNPGWEPPRLAEGVSMFLDDAEGWLRCSTFPVHEAAVRLHLRLLAIHPWSNGNGRHARLMADILVAANEEEPLSWGARAPRADAGPARDRYVAALGAAEAGDFGPLVAFAMS